MFGGCLINGDLWCAPWLCDDQNKETTKKARKVAN